MIPKMTMTTHGLRYNEDTTIDPEIFQTIDDKMTEAIDALEADDCQEGMMTLITFTESAYVRMVSTYIASVVTINGARNKEEADAKAKDFLKACQLDFEGNVLQQIAGILSATGAENPFQNDVNTKTRDEIFNMLGLNQAN